MEARFQATEDTLVEEHTCLASKLGHQVGVEVCGPPPPPEVIAVAPTSLIRPGEEIRQHTLTDQMIHAMRRAEADNEAFEAEVQKAIDEHAEEVAQEAKPTTPKKAEASFASAKVELWMWWTSAMRS